MAKGIYVGVQEEEYIQSSGSEWIDTGVTPNQNFGFEIDFVPLNAPVSSGAPAYINAGGAGGNVGVNLRVAINVFTATATPNGEIQLGDFKSDNGLTQGVRQTIKLRNKEITFPDGTTATATTNDFTSPNTLFIFAAHMTTGAAAQRMSSMKLYSLKLYNGDTLVKDLVPAYNNNQFCLYDKVNDNYLYSSGGTLTGNVGSKARKVSKAYVGMNNTAREILKGYVGVNGTARLCFKAPYPIYKMKVQVSADHTAQSMISHTQDYIVVAGGGTDSNSPKKTVEYVNKNGVVSSATDLPTPALLGGGMTISGYSMTMSGISASSWGVQTKQVITYNNNMVQSTASDVTQNGFEPACASNGSKGIYAGGCYYYSNSNKTDIYNSSLVKTNISNLTYYRRGNCASYVGGYFVLCGGNDSSTTSTEFYNSSNTKTTGSDPYGKKCVFPLGLYTTNHAMFFGGATADNVNNAFTNCVAYDSNLVKQTFALPIAAFKCRGFICPDGKHVWVGFNGNANSWLYNDNLVVEKIVDQPNYIGNANARESDSTETFGVYKQSWTTNLTIFDL